MERDDEPLTPVGRMFLRPELNQIINCLIRFQNPIDIEPLKSQISNVMLRHPKFCSLLIKDSKGREHWRKTSVNIDDHFIIIHEPLSEPDPNFSEDDVMNDYLADLSVSSSLSLDKPLWEIRLLMAHKSMVCRAHHAIGDGISLMSMLMALCRRVDEPDQLPTIPGSSNSSSTTTLLMMLRRRWKLCRLVKMVWYTLIFVIELILRSSWLKDETTAVSGGDGVELWPRKLATAKFRLDDMKIVKEAVPEATINDVLFGILSRGISQYLDSTTPGAVEEGLQLTGVAMVNLRPQPGLQDFSKMLNNNRNSTIRFGNQIGMFLLPIYYHKEDGNALQFVERAKVMLDKKKQSLEAFFAYKIGAFVTSYFGPKVASLISYRIFCNTTFIISNVIGPVEEIAMVGNPITHIRSNLTSLPNAITMHMVSYAGRAEMQILVAKDIIPDPKVLAKCFEDALLEMKELTVANSKKKFGLLYS